jgi:hypothetical protein
MGTGVFRAITGSARPPATPMRSESGVTSSSRASGPSLASEAAWIAAPMATTSSGSMFALGGCWKYSETALRITGRRVGPPTRITPSRSRTVRLACCMASSHTLNVRMIRSITRPLNSSLVILR